MTFLPDYGASLLRDGLSHQADQFFHNFKLFDIAVLGHGNYSTMVEWLYDGERHALSLDFNRRQLDQILTKASENIREYVEAELICDPETPRRITFEGEVTFGVRARLGQIQKVSQESFVPLVVQEVL